MSDQRGRPKSARWAWNFRVLGSWWLLAILVLVSACSSFDPWAEYAPIRVTQREPDGIVVRIKMRGIDLAADRAVVMLSVLNESSREVVVAPEAVTVIADDGTRLVGDVAFPKVRTVLLPGGTAVWRIDCASPDARRVKNIPLDDPVVIWAAQVGARTVRGRAAFEVCDPRHLQDEPFSGSGGVRSRAALRGRRPASPSDSVPEQFPSGGDDAFHGEGLL